MKQSPKNLIYSNGALLRLVVPLMIELALQLVVGLLDSIMVSSVGESAVSGVSLVDSVMQLLIYIFSALAAGEPSWRASFWGPVESRMQTGRPGSWCG